jgi:hypothetical protein
MDNKEGKKIREKFEWKRKTFSDILLPRKDFPLVMRSCSTIQHPLHYVTKPEALTSGVFIYLLQKISKNIKARPQRTKEGSAVRMET